MRTEIFQKDKLTFSFWEKNKLHDLHIQEIKSVNHNYLTWPNSLNTHFPRLFYEMLLVYASCSRREPKGLNAEVTWHRNRQKECCFRSLKDNNHNNLFHFTKQERSFKTQQSRKLKGPQGEERSKEKNGIQQEEDTHYPSVKKWWPAFWKGSGHEMCAKRNETHLPPKRWGRKNRHSTFPDGCLICPMLIVSEAFYWLFMGCGATDLPDKAVQSHFAFRDVTKRMHFIVIVALINPCLNLQCPSHTVSVYILITLLAIPKESFLSLY